MDDGWWMMDDGLDRFNELNRVDGWWLMIDDSVFREEG